MIELNNVTFTYSGASAPSVEGFSMKVSKGECVVLAGPSGCGKTTVTRLINGLAPSFYEGALTGSVTIDGRPASSLSAAELAGTVGSVFQDPRSQFFTTDTTSEIAFSCENAGMPRDEILDRVALSAAALGAVDLLERSIFELSSGEKQRIAVASACALSPDVVVLDEPSANLDPESTSQLGDIISRLKAAGKTVVVAEHRLYYLREVFDRVVVMDGGRTAAEMGAGDILRTAEAELSALGLRSIRPELLSIPDNHREAGGAALLEARALSFSYGRRSPSVLQGVDLSVWPSEIVAVVGENGAGKSTLVGVLCGLRRQSSGEVRVCGKPLSPKERRKASSFVMQDADYQLFAASVADELKLGVEGVSGIDGKVCGICSELELSDLVERHPASLSGGQKQRVVIAAAIAKGARLVFLDEPTSGLDGKSMKRVAEAVRALASETRAVFVITHDFEFVLSCCTRIVRIEDGTVACDVPVKTDEADRVRKAFYRGRGMP